MMPGCGSKRALLRVNALEIKWAIGPLFSILYKSNMRLYRVDGCAKPAAVRIDEYRLTLSGVIFFAHQIHTFRASCVQKDKIAVTLYPVGSSEMVVAHSLPHTRPMGLVPLQTERHKILCGQENVRRDRV